MSAKDLFHDEVKNALIKDGWTITADPYTLVWGNESLFVDLGAERILAAEKENQKIAVEVKSFVGRSLASDLQKAIGQYVQYRSVMKRQDPARVLWLAVPDEVFYKVFEGVKGEDLITDENIKVLDCCVLTICVCVLKEYHQRQLVDCSVATYFQLGLLIESHQLQLVDCSIRT